MNDLMLCIFSMHDLNLVLNIGSAMFTNQTNFFVILNSTVCWFIYRLISRSEQKEIGQTFLFTLEKFPPLTGIRKE